MASKPKLSADELCREFYRLSTAIRGCTSAVSNAGRCPDEDTAEPEVGYGGSESCLTMYFAVAGSDGESAAAASVAECGVCSAKLLAIRERRKLRHELSGVKRRIFNAGKPGVPDGR